MSTLYMIRHAQASFGSPDYDRLSPRGRQQARVLGQYLVTAGIRFDACWSGTLRRQRQTAGEVRDLYRMGGVELPGSNETAAFDEYDAESVLRVLIPIINAEDPAFGTDVRNMMADSRAFQQVFGRVMTRWVSGRDRLTIPISWPEFTQGVTGAVRKIARSSASGSHVAVFTSGGPIAAAVGDALGLSAKNTIALSWQLANASITRFKFSQGRVTLDTFNEYGHLQRGGKQDLVTHR
jgi:broad specificity phosphatase PhoE